MRTLKIFAAAAALTLSMAGAASATTFVNIAGMQNTGTDQISWVGAASGGGTLTISNLATVINFDDSVYNDGAAGLQAILNFTGTAATGADNLTVTGGNFTQAELAGTFEFRSLDLSTVYLAGTFSHYWLTGTVGATASGNVTSSIGTADFSSDLVDLSYVLDDNFQLGFTSVHPKFAVTGGTVTDGTLHGGTLKSFKANNVSGTYGGVSVPEPTTWALMIMGFGGAGAMLRRRKTAVA